MYVLAKTTSNEFVKIYLESCLRNSQRNCGFFFKNNYQYAFRWESSKKITREFEAGKINEGTTEEHPKESADQLHKKAAESIVKKLVECPKELRKELPKELSDKLPENIQSSCKRNFFR